MNLKKRNSSSEDWYLYNLSVIKEKQGQGIGKKLLKPMLDFLNKEHKGCYLETNKEENVSLYEHFINFYFKIKIVTSIEKTSTNWL